MRAPIARHRVHVYVDDPVARPRWLGPRRGHGGEGEPDAGACGARGQGYDQPVSSAWSNSGELRQEHPAVTHTDIASRVVTIVSEQLGDEDDISGDTRLTEDLNADILDTVQLIIDLEDVFEIAISDEEAGQLHTIGDVVKFIAKHESVDRMQRGPH